MTKSMNGKQVDQIVICENCSAEQDIFYLGHVCHCGYRYITKRIEPQ